MAGTIRFQALVDRSGRPDVYTPWSDPLKDSAFQRAHKQNRVLTIHQNLQGTKDFGEVGFQQGRGLQFLIFPKSLAWAEGKRVIGIHYEEVADAKFPVATAAAGAAAKTKTKSKKGAVAVKAREEKAEVAGKSAEGGDSEAPEERKRAEKREVRKAEEAEPEELKPEEPVKLDLDPLTVQLKSVLDSIEKKHVGKAKSLLKKMIEERAGAKG